MSDDFMYSEANEGKRLTVIQRDGVRITVAANRFEICAQPGAEFREPQVVQMLRDWMRRHKDALRAVGDLSG